MKRAFLVLFSCFSFSNADYYGVVAALSGASGSAAGINATVDNIEEINKELGETVKLNREILKAEIVRDTLLSKKIYWLQKIKNNLSRSADMDSISVQTNTLNNKTNIYNNSLMYNNPYLKDANE